MKAKEKKEEAERKNKTEGKEGEKKVVWKEKKMENREWNRMKNF